MPDMVTGSFYCIHFSGSGCVSLVTHQTCNKSERISVKVAKIGNFRVMAILFGHNFFVPAGRFFKTAVRFMVLPFKKAHPAF
jgi:hypothetical protein